MNETAFLFAAPGNAIEWILLIAAIVIAVALLGAVGFLTYRLIKDKKLGQLKEAIVSAIKEAEKTHASGEEKLQVALTFVRVYCDKVGLKLDDRLLDWVVDYICKYISDHNELEEIEEAESAAKAAEAKPAEKKKSRKK